MTAPASTISGKATVAGTFDYIEHHKVPAHQIPEVGWYLSRYGLGTYRMSIQNEEHLAVLKKALTSGINVVDSAINYMDEQSERLIGKALTEIINETDIQRDQLILISKAGYIQGTLLQKMKELEAANKGYEHLLKISDQIWYSLDPQFMKDMVDLSRKRMGVDTIDIYLVHNPEYALQYSIQQKKDSFDPALDDYLFYQQLKKAFIALEEKVKEGSIQFYGVSSNNLPTPPEMQGHVNILKVFAVALEAAEEVWGDGTNHHFRFVQFPFNLLESQAMLLKLDEFPEGPQTIFEFCRAKGIYMLANRPLNAIWNNKLYRFAHQKMKVQSKDWYHDIQKSISLLTEFEQYITKFMEREKIDNLPVGEGNLKQIIETSIYMRKYISEIEDLDQYYQFFYGFIVPRLDLARNIFTKALRQDAYSEGMDLFEKYINSVQFIVDLSKNYVVDKMNQRVKGLNEIIGAGLPSGMSSLSLAQKALVSLAHASPGLTILNGARQESYLKELLYVNKITNKKLSAKKIAEISQNLLKHIS
ncbi:MAG: aldo/keto reductase [Calditrichia bacterium]